MKNYEQKYKESLERARFLKENTDSVGALDISGCFEQIFPELKESEDERIRKGLIAMLSQDKELHSKEIAWLEKHEPVEQDTELRDTWEYIKEWNDKFGRLPKDEDELADLVIYVMKRQKPSDKVEPKFRNGQWIVWQDKCYKVNYNGCGYELVDQNGLSTSLEYGTIDENAHLWTIQDAKDGDVLEFGDHGGLVVGIVSYVNKTTGKVDVSCLLENNTFKVGIYYNLDTIKPHPVTKEQHDTLMKAMADAGYIFDFEKKELRKLKFRVGDIVKSKSQPMLDARKIISIDKDCYWCEDRGCIGFAWEDDYEHVEPQPKQEWSEEDDSMIEGIKIAILNYYDKENAEEIISWLKSLKPQKHWKPSKEQMDALNAINLFGELSYVGQGGILIKLYNDLKTLI